jgi:Na+-driven multidrug efflux pump
MMAFGIGVSLSVRLGVTLPRNVRRAKQLVWGTYLVSGFLFGLGSWALYRYRGYIYHIFTTDPLIMAGCEEIWGKVCLYFFLVSWFALSTGVANGLGKQWTLGLLLLGIFWCFGVPSLWYYGIDEAESLNVVWKWINPPYVFINLALLVVFVQADWDEISMDICKREGIDMKQVDHLGPYGITYGSVENERQLFVEAACKELVLV